jgi:transcriptional regulator with XRE-family HTH domain
MGSRSSTSPDGRRRRLNDAELSPEEKAAVDARRANRQTAQHQDDLARDIAAHRQEYPPLGDPELVEALAGLRRERERQGLSLTNMAERTGIDRATISKLETGKIAKPTIGTLIGLVALVLTALTSPLLMLRAGEEPGSTKAAESRDVCGFVVDERGRPVANADVSYVWRSNGPYKDENGKDYEDVRSLWGNVGKMYPWGESPALTGRDGRFLLRVPHQFHALLALDSSREHGGLVILPAGREKTEVKIAMGPLVRLKGTLEGPNAGNRPVWTHVYTDLPDDPERPLDMTVLVSCEAMRER